MPDRPDFNRLVDTINNEVKTDSDRLDLKQDPPSYAAHVMLDGNEYMLTLMPTDLDRAAL